MSVLFAVLFYFAAIWLIVGIVRKVVRYSRIPSPLKIPTTPAPTTKTGVVLRMFREVVFFESLYKSNKWIWIFGWLFHFALMLVLIRHLRYFIEPVWFWVAIIQPYGYYAGYVMVLGLLGLWARRFLVDRVRYISSPSDHLILLLLLSIGVTGLLMKFVWHTDIVAVKAFFIGLMTFSFQSLPSGGGAGDVLLYVHLFLVWILMMVFAYSKLLHAPGIFFSPTRHQVDNPRERRFIADWAARLDTQKAK